MELGPGVLGNIFDGIQRPLKQIAIDSGDVFIPRGVACPSLDIVKQWEFQPKGFKVGYSSLEAVDRGSPDALCVCRSATASPVVTFTVS